MVHKTVSIFAALLCATFAFDDAHAQSPIRVTLAEGDTITKDEATTVLSNIGEEYNQLERRIRATTVLSDPLSIVVGRLVGQAMTRVVALKPAAGVRLIGIVGQQDAPEGPSFVLYDLSGWIDRGRPLDSLQAFSAIDVLPDAAMRREGGRQFKVDNVTYAAAWVGDRLRIGRVTGQ